MNTPFPIPTSISLIHRTARGFSLVEVTLAIAVVAIGLVGIMALFPLGMDAVRQAADSTQMMAIGQDAIAYYQQEAVSSNCYAGYPSAIDPTQVIDPSSPLGFGSYSNNIVIDGSWYRIEAVVTNAGYSTIAFGIPLTNMISRVQIGVYRIATNIASPYYRPIGRTNYYFTEVDRYVQ